MKERLHNKTSRIEKWVLTLFDDRAMSDWRTVGWSRVNCELNESKKNIYPVIKVLY